MVVPQDKTAQLIVEGRKEKDHWFKQDPHSPIPEKQREDFRGLNYFPYNPKFRVKARFQPYHNPELIRMTTSTGTQDNFLRYGYFEFEIEGKTYRLQAYKSAHTESIFIPFRDLTSGKESYGSGRYLDIEEHQSEVYTIDFNLAYNPYCAYSDNYVCPLPPRENWLSVEVRAGEKNYIKTD